MVCTGIAACSKDTGIRQDAALLGKLQINNKSLLPEDSLVIKIDDQPVQPYVIKAGESAEPNILREGMHTLSVYTASDPDSLLLKREVLVGKNLWKKISLFRANNTDPLNIVDINKDTIAVPAAEHVKISIANFTTHLPANIDLLLLQQVNNNPRKTDTVARFENVKNHFTPFKEIKLSRNQANQLVYAFTLAIYDRDARTVISQNIASSVAFNAETKIYALYINTYRVTACQFKAFQLQ